MDAAASHKYAEQRLSRAPQLQHKVEEVRRKLESSDTSQHLLTAEAAELSKLQQLTHNPSRRNKLTARQLASLTSEQLFQRLGLQPVPPEPAPVRPTSSTRCASGRSHGRRSTCASFRGSGGGGYFNPDGDFCQGSGGGWQLAGSGDAALNMCASAFEAVQQQSAPPLRQDVAAHEQQQQQQQAEVHQQGLAQHPAPTAVRFHHPLDSQPAPAAGAPLAATTTSTLPGGAQVMVVEVPPAIMKAMGARLSSLYQDRPPDLLATSNGWGRPARPRSPPRSPPAAAQRAWSPPGARRVPSPLAAAGRTRQQQRHPANNDKLLLDQQQQQQQQQASRPGTSASSSGRPLGRWSAQRDEKERRRQQQLVAAGQLLQDIDTTIAAVQHAPGSRSGGCSPGRPGTCEAGQQQQEGSTAHKQQQQQCGESQIGTPQGGTFQNQLEAATTAPAKEPVPMLLQASMVLRWQRFNTPAAAEAAANTNWLTGILAEAPAEEDPATADAWGHTWGSNGQLLQRAAAADGGKGAADSGAVQGQQQQQQQQQQQDGGAARRDLCHWPGALPGSTHGHMSPDKLTFTALPGSKRQVHAQLADARAGFQAIQAAGKRLDQLQLQQHKRQI